MQARQVDASGLLLQAVQAAALKPLQESGTGVVSQAPTQPAPAQ